MPGCVLTSTTRVFGVRALPLPPSGILFNNSVKVCIVVRNEYAANIHKKTFLQTSTGKFLNKRVLLFCQVNRIFYLLFGCASLRCYEFKQPKLLMQQCGVFVSIGG